LPVPVAPPQKRRESTLTCTDLRYDDHVSVPAPTRHRPGTWPHLTRRCNMSDGTCCSIDDCDREHYALGLCNKHWQRQRPTASTADPVRIARLCTIDGCDRPHLARGMCRRRWKLDDYERNRDTIQARRRDERRNDPEKFNAASRRYYADHRDEVTAARREYYAANGDVIRA